MATYKELEARGVSISRTSTDAGVHLEAKLPKESTVHVSFHKEGVKTTIAKWFKSEITTGDSAFDAAIYIDSESDPALIGKLLADETLRGAIGLAVAWGGNVEIDGATVVWEQPNEDPPEDAVVRLVTFALDA